MNDRAITPAAAVPGSGPGVEVTSTLRAVITDLAELVGELPVPADQVEASARILDRLAEEITEAAAMLRAAQDEPGEARP
jgi:hypothetical protein